MKRLFWLSLISLSLSSCAQKPVTKTLNLDECISDGTGKFECSGPAFDSQKEKLGLEQGWICKDPITDKAYWDSCYLQRQVNGK